MSYSPAKNYGYTTSNLVKRERNILVYKAVPSIADPACVYDEHWVCGICHGWQGSLTRVVDAGYDTAYGQFKKDHVHPGSEEWFLGVFEDAIEARNKSEVTNL